MASPSYSVLFHAKVSGSSSTGSAGDVLIPSSAGSDFVLATTANRGSRRSTGIALGSYSPNQNVEIQQHGQVDWNTYNLGAGAASWVRCSATGRPERCTPSGSDDVIGWCDADGTLHLITGFLTPTIVNGGGTVPTGTGFRHITSGVEDGASAKVSLAASADVTLPGADTQVLFRDGTVVGADAGMTYDKTNDVLSVVGAVTIGSSVAATGNIRVGTTAGNGEFITFKYNGGSDYTILQMSGAAFYLGNSGFNARMDGNVITLFSASDTQFYSNSAQKLYLASTGLQVGAGATDHGGGNGVVGIDNAGTDPTTNPTGGGILYASGGAGKWRGSSGTVTTFGPADPHCPTCGRDFAVEHQNDTLGEHLALCLPCLVDALKTAGIDTSTFTIADKRGATKAEWNAAHAEAKLRVKQPAPPPVGGNNASES